MTLSMHIGVGDLGLADLMGADHPERHRASSQHEKGVIVDCRLRLFCVYHAALRLCPNQFSDWTLQSQK